MRCRDGAWCEEGDGETGSDQPQDESCRIRLERNVALQTRRGERRIALCPTGRPRGKIREDLSGEIPQHRIAPDEPMSARKSDHETFAGERAHLHSRRDAVLVQPEERDVKISALHGGDEGVAVSDPKLYPHGRMRGTEPHEQSRQIHGRDRRDHSEPERSDDVARSRCGVFPGCIRGGNRDPRLPDEGLPRLGEPYTSAGPREEPLSDLTLQRRDLMAQRRLGDEAALRCTSEARGIGHLDDVTQLLKVHTLMIAVHGCGDNYVLDSSTRFGQAGSMNRLTILLITALAPIAWGTTYLVTTELLPVGHPMFAGLLRSLPAGLIAVAVSRTLPRGGWWFKSFALGALNIGAFFPLLFLAAERLPGGVAAAVAGVQPLIVLSLGTLVLKERIRPMTAAAAVAGAGGVALVVLGPAARLDALGILAALGGVTATALGMILTKRWGRPVGVGPVGYAGWQLAAGGLLQLPLTLLVEGTPASIDSGAVLGYLWLATAGGIIAYTLWFRGIQKLPMIASGLLALLSPVVATLLGTLVAGESFTPIQAVGFAIALLALIGGQLSVRPAQNLQPPLVDPNAATALTVGR